jgi:uridine phosphorylase
LKEVPLFLNDFDEEGVITPKDYFREKKIELLLPEKAIISFWWPSELVEEIKKLGKGEFSYARHVKIVEIETERIPISCVIMQGVGAPLAAATLEEIITLGVKKAILLGGAGALIEMPDNALILPTEAIRDEGTSYHYLPPRVRAGPSQRLQEKLRESIQRYNFPIYEGKTWSTDAFYRETPARIEKFRSEGAICVEMEAAACFAVGEYRKVELGALFFPTDILIGKWRFLNIKKDYQKILQIVIDALMAL